MNEPFEIDGELYVTLESGKTVNVSELRRIFEACFELVEPGMSEEQIVNIAYNIVKRMSPN